jgi:hypothetical protein
MRRNPDVQLGSYMRQVDAELVRAFGLGFKALQQDVDVHDGPQLTQAAAAGMAPQDFVREFGAHYPLKAVGPGEDPEGVGKVNRGIMALGTFARESVDWVQLGDGAAYRQDEGGVSRLVSSRDAKGVGVGFRAEHAEGAELGPLGQPTAGARFERIGGGIDIGVSVEALYQALQARMSGPGLR